jgi:hypothetical protein
MHRHEMQQLNIYLGIYTIEYYFLLKKNQGVTVPYPGCTNDCVLFIGSSGGGGGRRRR